MGISREKMIEHLAGLCAHMEATSPHHFGRNLYKYTDCGPWTQFIQRKSEPFVRQAVIEIVWKQGRLFAQTVPAGGKPSAPTERMLEVLDFKTSGEPWKDRAFAAYRKLTHSFLKKTGGQCGTHYRETNTHEFAVTLEDLHPKKILRFCFTESVSAVERKVYYNSDEANAMIPNCVGVAIGSIVEGSDAEVGPKELRFPFTAKQLDEAVQAVNSEASELWHEANDEPRRASRRR